MTNGSRKNLVPFMWHGAILITSVTWYAKF